MLKATIEWRVFLKRTRQVYLVVRLFAFVFLFFEHKHEKSASLYMPLTASLWVSAGFSLSLSSCLRLSFSRSLCPSFSVSVSVCRSVLVCRSVCRSLCLSVRLSVCLSVCLLVCRSFCLSVRLSVCLRLSRSGACREKVSAWLCVCACYPRPTHNHSITREGAMDDHGW